MNATGHHQGREPLKERKGNKARSPENREHDDFLSPLTGKRVKAVLRTGLGLVGTLVALAKAEVLLELDTGGCLVVMKHAIEYVEPLEETEAWAGWKNNNRSKVRSSGRAARIPFRQSLDPP